MALSDREAAMLLASVGHHPEGLERRKNGYWYAHCGCGYLSARRTSERLAADALIHHMRKAAAQLVADGVSLPGVTIFSR